MRTQKKTRRGGATFQHEYANYPSINFNRLFGFVHDEYGPEKIKCIIAYFRKIASKKPEDETLVTFERCHLPLTNMPRWFSSSKTLTNLHVDACGTIEDNGFGMLQVDFANAFIGGGVLGRGCVQEEIRFLISPELIVSRLFTERLADNECLVMTGFERFSNYTGYASSFKFSGMHDDQTRVDANSGHRLVRLVAIDALFFSGDARRRQYSKDCIERELNKAFVGFRVGSGQQSAAVATGNWGCGAFGGDPRLKALLQMLAAAEAGRDLAYFTFGDRALRDDLERLHSFLREKEVKVGAIVDIVVGFSRVRSAKYNDLFEHIYNTVLSYEVGEEDEG